MTPPAPTAAEAEIHAAFSRGDHSQAAGLLVQHYGREILTFLHDRMRSRSAAEEAFSHFAENVVRGMPTLAWHSTARAWAYSIARNAAADYFRDPDHRPERLATLSDPAVDRIANQVRTATAPHLRSAVKNRFRELRRELSEEDQTILVLRVDRALPWEEIAVITLGATLQSNPTELKAEAARVRQRFKRAKEALRQLAIEAGLINDEGGDVA